MSWKLVERTVKAGQNLDKRSLKPRVALDKVRQKHKEMTYLDIIILLPVAYGIVRGIMQGLVREVFALVGIILGIVLARIYGDSVTVWLTGVITVEPALLKPIASFAIFIVVAVVCNILAIVITKLMKFISLGGLNRLIGGLFGAAKWILILSVIVAFVDILDDVLHFIQPELKESSPIWNYALKLASYLKSMVFPES